MSISARALSTLRPIPAPEPEIITSSPIGRGWYAVYTSVQDELRAKLGLDAKGFGTFLPMEVLLRVRRGRRVKSARPVFSRYVFVSFDPDREEWFDPIKSTDGVEAILENNGSPVRIPAMEIEELRRAEELGAFDKSKGPQIDEYMRVATGPFAGLIGKVRSAKASGRIKILLNMLNNQIVSEFSLGDLERIS